MAQPQVVAGLVGDCFSGPPQAAIEYEGRLVIITNIVKGAKVGVTTATTVEEVITGNYYAGPIDLVLAVAACNGILARILGGDIDIEGREILRYLKPHPLDIFELEAAEAVRVAVPVIGW
jgi:hypothetical protein